MEVYFTPRNKGKVDFIVNMLSKYGIEIIHIPVELPESKKEDIQEIARQKVLTAYSRIKMHVIALDSGFYIYFITKFLGK